MTQKKYHRKRIGPRLCSFPGCRAVVLGGRCEEHRRVSADFSERRREGKQFLNSVAWRRCRAHKLSIAPWCELCEARKDQPVPAVDVHHILPRHTQPELSLTLSNLQSLCRRCHGELTAKECRRAT
jgi:5-methylcytosine-specific restriction protein A